jgi:hypothetical protein
MGLGHALAGCGPTDADADGFIAEDDCDDQNPAVNPSVAEVCDNVDNDCDGLVDADATDRTRWFADSDGDGFGDPTQSLLACESPVGAVANDSDCAPSDGGIYPGADESPGDRIDNDCDGMVDEVACPKAAVATTAQQVAETKGRSALLHCVPRPEDGSACASPKDLRGAKLVKQTVGPAGVISHPGGSAVDAYWFVNDPLCGPDEGHTESCCYAVTANKVPVVGVRGMDFLERALRGADEVGVTQGPDRAVHGRPLVVDGAARLAGTEATAGWAVDSGWHPVELDPERRLMAAAHWRQAAQYEHASVASFARFAMELMALGAPADLVMGATRAQADEIAHARDCFSMASAFAGGALGPGPLPLSGALAREVTPRALLVDAIVEACVNETLAAAEAAWLSGRSSVPVIAKLQETISQDESRHAALGWRTVKWLIQRHPELADTARMTFESARDSSVAGATESVGDEWMAAYGCMPSAAAARLQQRVWETVISPCADALLESHTI